MTLRIFFVCMLIVGAAAWSRSPAFGDTYKNEDEEAKAYNVTRTVKTVEGLHFLVENDRPIEKVGSIYRPIDLDSYVALKFAKLQKIMEDRFAALEERVAALEAEVASLKKADRGNPAEIRAKNQAASAPPSTPAS